MTVGRYSTILTGLLFALLCSPGFAALSPNEVVVVYNSSTANDGYDWSASKSVADYYCAARGIPSANEVGILFPYSTESTTPVRFNDDIATPLRAFLCERAGVASTGTPDLTADPTKAIVLCYGIPLKILGAERSASVDSAISLLFNTTSWGREPIGTGEANPYYYNNADNPLDRNGIPADFGEFRQSTYNSVPVTAPSFTIARMLDTTHALAAGRAGILYRGTWNQTGQKWDWDLVADAAKQFILGDVNDICVLDSDRAWLCTGLRSVLRTTNGGQDWTAQITTLPGLRIITSMKSVSFYADRSGWVVGVGEAANNAAHQFVYKWNSGAATINTNAASDRHAFNTHYTGQAWYAESMPGPVFGPHAKRFK